MRLKLAGAPDQVVYIYDKEHECYFKRWVTCINNLLPHAGGGRCGINASKSRSLAQAQSPRIRSDHPS